MEENQQKKNSICGCHITCFSPFGSWILMLIRAFTCITFCSLTYFFPQGMFYEGGRNKFNYTCIYIVFGRILFSIWSYVSSGYLVFSLSKKATLVIYLSLFYYSCQTIFSSMPHVLNIFVCQIVFVLDWFWEYSIFGSYKRDGSHQMWLIAWDCVLLRGFCHYILTLVHGPCWNLFLIALRGQRECILM